ncbi:VWFA domain-containing protein [Naegleria gruberi]|uniref:VWFA domain-containing protein n=1 Tax=Naegleria gruberi TaxID=5762 RepID=D2VZP7_NAEGR|nr:VWFA domain-containing protein [Naegleria gruberi]EFC37697.1 VWFA domain-containing protein [Naegleria gruberi]|eukprot:XP_002670441.1 VWFA domain-containing protein [Naegleria gruberi strain NEG-M]
MKEQCMICIDNSEWMRNGDYAPTRLDAQLEAANLICGSKTQSNPETTIGVLTMGDSNPSVKVAPTTDLGKLLSSLSSVSVGGDTHFSKALQIAYLVLKNRAPEQGTPNRRLVIFVGSPIEENKDDLVKLGLRMKKNGVACDVINFGEVHENTAKLEAFISSVNRDDNSRMETIPPGPHILSDMLLSSPIVGMGGAGVSSSPSGTGGAATGGEGGGDFEFGVDPSLDPELAMAIRLSLEEEKRRQEREKQSSGTSSTEQQPAAGSSSTTESTSALPTTAASEPTDDDDIEMEDDEALEKALLLSKQEAGMADEEEEEMDEDAALEAALRMSMEESKKNDENIDDIVEDQEFMQDLVGGLGKNVNSDEVLKKDKKDEEKK